MGFFMCIIFLGCILTLEPCTVGFYSWQPFFWNIVVKIPFAVDSEPVSNDGGFSIRIFVLDLLHSWD